MTLREDRRRLNKERWRKLQAWRNEQIDAFSAEGDPDWNAFLRRKVSGVVRKRFAGWESDCSDGRRPTRPLPGKLVARWRSEFERSVE